MFITIRGRIFAYLILLVLTGLVFCNLFFSVKTSSTPNLAFCIVIDAGHGGIDGGCVGMSTGVKESDLNLKYSKCLQKLCESFGMRVVMTRSNSDGLYSPLASNKKRSEMEKREEIIKKSNADLFVSIHMNSITNRSLNGAQVFYKKGSDEGKLLADSITNSLKTRPGKIRGESKVGDYYVLNCHDKAGVLIECGFLSNEAEEKLLQKDEYTASFCEGIFKGILTFIKM